MLAIRPADLTTGVPVMFDFFMELDRPDYDKHVGAHGRVADAVDGDLAVYAVAALEQINAMAAGIEQHMVMASGPLGPTVGNALRSSIAGAVLTFCAAVHLYQEQTEAAVVRHFGDGSAEHTLISRRFSIAYDSSLAYRLIYRLRNILVHHSMKSIGMSLSAQLEPTAFGPRRKIASVSVPLVRSEFLATRTGLSTRLRQEVAGLDSDPDIRDLAASALAALLELRQDSMELIHPRLAADCAHLVSIARLYPPWEEADRALAKVTIREGVPNFPYTLLRRDVLEFAEQVVNYASTDKPEAP